MTPEEQLSAALRSGNRDQITAAFENLMDGVHNKPRPIKSAQRRIDTGLLDASRAAVTQHQATLAEVDVDTLLTSANIAEMEARTAETMRADDYASHTEGHW